MRSSGAAGVRGGGALALAGEVGVGLFAVGVVTLHGLRRDLDTTTRFVSEYAVGPYGWLMTVSFGGLSAGSGAVAVSLARARIASPLDVSLLGAFSLGMGVAGLYRTDLSLPGSVVTARGRTHNFAARIAFHTVVPGMLLSSYQFKHDRRWRHLHGRGMALAVVAGVALIELRYSIRPGIPQRAFLATVAAWLGLVAHHLRVTHQGV